MAKSPLGPGGALGTSARIEARLARIEALLEGLAPVLSAAPAAIATVADVVDDAARSAAAAGAPVEPRVQAAARLVDTATRAETLAAFARLAEAAPALAPLAEALRESGPFAAMLGDMFDTWATEDPVGPDGRIRALLALVERLSRPEMSDALLWGLDRAEDLPGLAATLGDVFDEQMGQRLGQLRALTTRLAPLAGAIGAGLEAPPQRVGFFGLIRAMRDPDVQRGVGLTVNILQSLGRVVGETHALTTRRDA